MDARVEQFSGSKTSENVARAGVKCSMTLTFFGTLGRKTLITNV